MNFSQLGFGTFLFKTHGILLAILFVVLIWQYYKKIQKQGFPVDFFVNHFWQWFLTGILFARIATLALNPEIVETHGFFSLIAFWHGEISVPVFILAFLSKMYFDLRSQQFSFGRWLDLVVEPMLLFLCLEGLLAFLTGDRYGIATNLPWGVRYETFSVAEINPVHPITIYSAIVYGGTWLYYRKKSKEKNWKDKVFKGALFYKLAFLVLITEGLLFFIRGDVSKIGNTIFSKEFIVFVFVFLFLLYSKKYTDKHMQKK